MGSFIGYTNVEKPEYTVLKSTEKYEVRRYGPQLRAEVVTPGESISSSEGFRQLADYIFGNNSKDDSSEKIAMTTPVITEKSSSENIAMTSPVITESNTSGGIKMAFILPSKYQMSDLPKPNNPNVKICQIEGQEVAVMSFNGTPDEETFKTKSKELLDLVEQDSDLELVSKSPVAARYNPPWTIPMFRVNETMYKIRWLR